MALSDKARRDLEIAMANSQDSPDSTAKEVADAIDTGGNPQGSAVAEIGTTVDLVGVDGSGSNAAPLTGTESRLDVLEAKLDELTASLRAAGIIAT